MATVTRDLGTFTFSASADTDGANLTVTLDQSGGASATTYPADFSAADSVDLASITSWLDEVNQNGDSLGLEVRIEKSGGAILAAATSGGAYETMLTLTDVGGPYTASAVSFTYVDTAASKADWETAVVRYNQRWSKDMGGDNCYLTGSPASSAYDKLTVTYTPDPNVDVPVTGVEGTGEVDSVTVVGDAVAPVTSQPDAIGTGEVGTVTVTAPITVLVTGLEATAQVGGVDVVFGATVEVTGLEATGEVGSVTAIALPETYYFDASDEGPTDPTASWTNDANAFDGSTSTSAIASIGSTGELSGGGTDSPVSGPSTGTIEARIYSSMISSSDDLNWEIWTNGKGEQLLSEVRSTFHLASWSAYVELTEPTGGWTWQKINDLEVYLSRTGAVDQITARRVEVQVNAFDGATIVPVTGVEGTGEVGSVTTVTDQILSVTGLEATGEVGTATVTAPIAIPVTGLEATGQVGTVTVDGLANVDVTGVEGTGEVGSVTVVGAANTAVTGLEATGEVGTATVEVTVTQPVTGLEATGEVGTTTVTTEQILDVTGLEGTGEVGSVTVAAGGAIFVPVTGVEATGGIGSVTVEGIANVPVTGLEASGAVGSVTVIESTSVDVPVTGLEATGAVGSAAVSTSANISVTGLEATGEVGSVTVIAVSNVDVPVIGLSSTGEVGSVTVVAGGTVDVPVTGVQAVGSVGDVTVSEGLSVTVTGLESTGEVGSVAIDSGGVTVFPTGLEASGIVNRVYVIARIVPSQDPNWVEEIPSQSPSWVEKTPTQDPDWEEIVIP